STAKRHVVGGPGIQGSNHAQLALLPVGEITTRYLIMLEVTDEPGVLATVAQTLAEQGVSAASVEQTSSKRADSADAPGTATLVIGTHTAKESALAETVRALEASDVVQSVTSVLRMEGNS